MKPYLVIYDITDNNQRRKVAKELKRIGLYRIQKSAFLGISSPVLVDKIKEIFVKFLREAQNPNDSYVIIPLNITNINEITVITSDETFDLELYLDRKDSYFI